MLNRDIKSNEDAIKKHQDENLRFQQHLNELEPMEFDADIMDYLADNFNDEVNELVENENVYNPKPVKAKRKPATKGGQPAFKGRRQTTTEERWNLLETGSMFRAKHKEVIRYYMKVAEGKVAECDKEGNLNIEKDSFENNQDAANDFRKIANISYSISGWEFLQLYNKDTDKAKSLKKWDGVLEYLVW